MVDGRNEGPWRPGREKQRSKQLQAKINQLLRFNLSFQRFAHRAKLQGYKLSGYDAHLSS